MILTLDAALQSASAGLVEGDRLVAHRVDPDPRGANLPSLAAALIASRPIAAVAVTVGPGSFTGLRAALALAHGIALGRAVPLHGVSVAAALHGAPGPRARWTAIDTRRGRLFLDIEGRLTTVGLDGLPPSDRPMILAGDAAEPVAALLRARGDDVLLAEHLLPQPVGIARAAGREPSRPAQPLYVDPPEARPGPAARPPPE